MKKNYCKLLMLLVVVSTVCNLSAQQNKPLPYSFDFNAAEFAADWSVVNVNEDTKTWTIVTSSGINGPSAQYSYHSTNAANDWMISPAFTLETGKIYKITFNQKVSNGSSSENLRITMGASNQIESQTTTLLELTGLTNSTATPRSISNIIVASSGNYHIGFYCYSPKNKWNLLIDDFKIEEVLPYPNIINDLSVSVGEQGAMQATLQWTNPTTNNAGAPLDQITEIRIYRNGTLLSTVTDNLTKGAVVSYVDQTITTAGSYKYKVIACNANGATPGAIPETTSEWVGQDTPTAPTDVVLTNTNNKLSLIFTAPTVGKNGGWINKNSLYYTITRYPGAVQTDHYTTPIPFEEQVTLLANYYYEITATTDGGTSLKATSNKVVAGESATIPYRADFTSGQDPFNLFTVINPDNDSNYWKYNTTAKSVQISSNPLNDWLITPNLALEAGRSYKASISAKAYSSTNAKKIKILVGKGATVEALSSEIFNQEITSAYISTYSANFYAPTSGNYNIGIYAYDGKGYMELSVTEVKVEAIVVPAAAATNLTIQEAPLGGLEATISWDNPVKTSTGAPLSELISAKLYRNDTLIQTINNPTIGATESFVDDQIATAGKYNYKVVVANQDGESAPISLQSGWIGYDQPNAVTDVALIKESNTDAKLTFTAPSTSVNGGYVDYDALLFQIERNPGRVLLTSSLSTTTYIDSEDKSLSSYSYIVTAISNGMQSSSIESNKVVFGTELTLPYTMTFTPSEDFGIWTVVDANNDGKTWAVKSSGTYANSVAYDAYSTPNEWLFTPPFRSFAGNHLVNHSIRTYQGNRYEQYAVTIGQTTNPDDHTIIKEYNFASGLYNNKSDEFTLPSEGVWYIGFHLYSEDPWGTFINKVEIKYTDVVDNKSITTPHNITYDHEALYVGDGCSALSVISMGGVVLISEPQAANKRIDLSKLQNGVYLVRYQTDEGVQSIKVTL